MTNSIRWTLMTSAAMVSFAGTAHAQSDGAADNLPGDIIVTATRQSTAISRVPISVSAYDQKAMDTKGIKSIEDAIRFTPGVAFDPGDNSISIRGISSGAGAGTTGIYIDDTPIQMRALGFSADDALPAIFDLERLEILRGPQGTLFGAGSEGGTVRYITPQPGLTDFSVVGRAELATVRHGGINYEGGLAVGGPIVKDLLGFRVSGYHRRDGGWVDKSDEQGIVYDKNVDHSDVTVLRGALAFQPAEGLKITPTIHYQERKVNALDNFVEALSDRHAGVFKDSSPEYVDSRDEFYMPSLAIDYGTDAVRLISNTSYYHRNNTTGYDGTMYNLSYYESFYLDAVGEGPFYPFISETGINPDLPTYLSPSHVTNAQRNFTQEVRLQSNNPASPLQWVAGVFYQRSRQRSTEELIEPEDDVLFPTVFGMGIADFFGYPLYGRDSYINETRAVETQIAGFADVTYSITDKLKITAGGRYAKVKYSFRNFADGSQNFGRTEATGKSSDKPFTPKVGLSYQADPDNMVYATWSKGFRAGGANPPVPLDACGDSLREFGLDRAPSSFGSDKVESWEIGAKNRLFDRKLQLAASAYTISWKDIQQAVFLPVCSIQYTDNLGSARSRGFDLQVSVAPVSGLTIDAALGYNDSKYTRTVVFGDGASLVSKGDKLGAAPWTGSIGAQYSFPVAGRDSYVRADYEYSAKVATPTPRQNPANGGYDPATTVRAATNFVSLRAGMDVVEGANLSLFVDNLFDSAPLISRAHNSTDSVYFTQTTLRPRTIGLTLSYRQ